VSARLRTLLVWQEGVKIMPGCKDAKKAHNGCILHDSTILSDLEKKRTSGQDTLAIQNREPNKCSHRADLRIFVVCMQGPNMGEAGLCRLTGLEADVEAFICEKN